MSSGSVPQPEGGDASFCFQDGVSDVLMATEEVRQSVLHPKEKDPELVLEWVDQANGLFPPLERLWHYTQDHPEDTLSKDLHKHCEERVASLLLVVFETSSQYIDKEVQPAMARLAELQLLLSKESSTQIIEAYANYQRTVLRERSKPAIARLAKEQQQHAQVMSVILGHGSALLHPLVLWKDSLEDDHSPLWKLCNAAIETVEEQAQSLAKTVSDWFWKQETIQTWLTRQTSTDEAYHQDLGELDSLVEEMAFGCQILARYESFVQEQCGRSSTLLSEQVLPEWTWKYATLERYLATQQWHSALSLAAPVEIVIGADIRVPSVVEDAQYLSTRALERAASTRSSQATGTVAHSISTDVWSTDNHQGSVHTALLEQRGCWVEPKKAEDPKELKRSGSNSFASALLGALDEDLSKSSSEPTQTPNKPSSRPPSAPSSGGFLGSLSSSLGSGGGDTSMQMRLDTELCTLNGIHSASKACTSLVEYLDSLLEGDDETNMIQLAREELFRYAQDYDHMLQQQVQVVFRNWCGSVDDPPSYSGTCLPVLKYMLVHEEYDLDYQTYCRAEADARLEHEFLLPLRESRILSQLSKCDAGVLSHMGQQLVSSLVELVLQILWSNPPTKRFTDWGSLLLSKQVRMLNARASTLFPEGSYLETWERLSQVVTVLQLEKPSDWSAYQSTSVLTPEELRATLSLRVGFSQEAIAAVVASVTPKDENGHKS